MKLLFFIIVFALLAVFASAQQNCDDIVCTYQYEPVCVQAEGTLPVTIGNRCAVKEHSCRQKKR